MPPNVLGLVLRDGQPQQPDPPYRLGYLELGAQLVDLLLRGQRPSVYLAGAHRPVALAGIVVEGGDAGDQKAAVASARPARDGVPLEQDGLDAAPGEPES